MMDFEKLEEGLSALPLYYYAPIDPKGLEFSQRIRYICQMECPMYGKTWACPPGVGTVDCCRSKCLSFDNCLLVSSIVEVNDIADMEETLATRPEHEALTNEVRDLMRAQGVDPYILSTEACSICESCAILEGKPCRFPGEMHPCVESHGINVVPILESRGLEFQFGANVVTWISLLFY